MKKTNLKKLVSVTLAIAMAASLTACLGSGTAETTAAAADSSNDTEAVESTYTGKSYKLKMSSTVGEQSNAVVVAKAFADGVKAKTGGAVEISVYASDQLSGGDMAKGVENIQNGAIDCAFEPVDVMANLDKTLLTLSLPWTFDSYADATASLQGDGGAYITNALDAKGIHTIGFIHNGFRQLTNSKRAVATPEDIKNLKLRVPGGDVFMNFFKALGCDPVAMSFSELFTALQQGTVDGQENGFDLITTNKFYEVQKYITEWNYSYGAFALVFNKATWDGFDDELKTILLEEAEEACALGNKNVEDSEADKIEICKTAGCEITELTDEQIEAFKAVPEVQAYYTQMKELYGEEACKAFGIE